MVSRIITLLHLREIGRQAVGDDPVDILRIGHPVGSHLGEGRDEDVLGCLGLGSFVDLKGIYGGLVGNVEHIPDLVDRRSLSGVNLPLSLEPGNHLHAGVVGGTRNIHRLVGVLLEAGTSYYNQCKNYYNNRQVTLLAFTLFLFH
jgi:hypothetical protein